MVLFDKGIFQNVENELKLGVSFVSFYEREYFCHVSSVVVMGKFVVKDSNIVGGRICVFHAHGY